MQQPAPKPVSVAQVAQQPCNEQAHAGAMAISAAVAPIVLSLVAVVIAWKANKINHGQAFMGRALDGLVELRSEARGVQKLYERLFQPFASVKEKGEGRTAFAKAQEEVTMHVEYLGCAFDELSVLKQLWDDVVEVEDSHAASDATRFNGAANVPQKKAEAIAAFIEKTAECVQALRNPGKKPLTKVASS
jgi:hypothetical protein